MSIFPGLIFFSSYILTKCSAPEMEMHMRVWLGNVYQPMKSVMAGSAWSLGLPLFPELAFPCILRRGPSLLFSSHNRRLLLASWPRPSYGVQPAELSGMREVGAEHTHPRPGQARELSCSWLWLFAVGLRGCLFDPFFFCSQEGGPSPAAHFLSARLPSTTDGERRKHPILEYSNHPLGLAAANAVSGFHCFMLSLPSFVKENSFLDVP